MTDRIFSHFRPFFALLNHNFDKMKKKKKHSRYYHFIHESINESHIMYVSGLTMNILRVGNKSFVQRGFFRNSAGDLFPTLGFPGGLYIFCNFVTL